MICLIGCMTVSTPSAVSISYTPEKTAQTVKNAGTISVTVNDLRANPSKVGNDTGVINRAGNRTILANENVADVVRSAVEIELKDRGFKIGGGAAAVMIDISEFDVERAVTVANPFSTAESYHSYAKVLLHVEVTKMGHKPLYSKLIFGQSNSADGA